jgi:hypothetical protein
MSMLRKLALGATVSVASVTGVTGVTGTGLLGLAPKTAEAGDCHRNVDRIARLLHILQCDRDEDHREDAAEDLGKYGDPGVVPYLARAASFDPCKDVREEAGKAIERIQRRFPNVPVYAPLAQAPQAAVPQQFAQPVAQPQPQPQPQFVPPAPQPQPEFRPAPVQPRFEQPAPAVPQALPQGLPEPIPSSSRYYGSASGSAVAAGAPAAPVAPVSGSGRVLTAPTGNPAYVWVWNAQARQWVLARR